MLRDYRTAARLTQEELAEESGISSRTIRDVERGAVRAPRKASLEALAEALALPEPERTALFEAARTIRRQSDLDLQVSRTVDADQPGTADDAAARTDPPPRELPADSPSFIGRGREVEMLAGLQQGSRQLQIVAIVGIAGVGKTALAVHWAHRIAQDFPDGQLYVDLRGYDPDQPMRTVDALAGFLRSLGVSGDRIPVDDEDAAKVYRSLVAGKRLLIVVDNARTPEQIRPLLPGLGESLVIVTSRHSLTGLVARDGARRILLNVLPEKEAVALLTQMLGDERVAAEPLAVTDLAQRCSCIPLSLLTAAANLAFRKHRPISDLVLALDKGDPLVELTLDGDQSGSIRAVLNETYATLSESEQRAFRLVSVVPGSAFTTDAVSALLDVPKPEADLLLQGLATVHMVHEQSFGRYTLHDLIRSFGKNLAASAGDGTQAAIARMLNWYLDRTLTAAELVAPERIRLPAPAWREPDGQAAFDGRPEALAWLVAERHNLVAAIHHAARSGPVALSWYLVDALRGFFWLSSPAVEWLGCADAALTAARAHDAADGEAAVSLGIAQLLLHHGQHSRALQVYLDSLAAMRRAGWAVGEATAMSHIGNVHMHSGDLDSARDLQQQTLGMAQRLGLEKAEACALHALGRIEWYAGALEVARTLVQQSYTICVRIGDRYGSVYALIERAMIDADLGHYPAAMEALDESFRRSAELGTPVLQVRCRSTLAYIHSCLGRDAEATKQYEQAVQLARGINIQVHEVEAVIGLATMALRRGDLPQARQHVELALEICRPAGFRLLEADAYAVLAEIRYRDGFPAEAQAHHDLATAIYEKSGYLRGRDRMLAMPHSGSGHQSAAMATG
ncbi:hypothetical protein Ahu01nite_076120 [Winogradskya humida]|uniref:HTH cro/C1-type domain-containing protein n=1 Tax=Winogradskya humida TaxID=113566 RepID=A0ABQ4A0W2_9ACTN|nr:hypothetical protein Ahu01nite_076120 [Actinoplanes humidus]